MTPDDLREFEKQIAELYNEGKIKAPVHLAGGNEAQLIEVFEQINHDTDWIFSTWRNHYHWLLFGLGDKRLRDQILAGKSMLVSDAKQRFFTSSIVAGIAPIALGVAKSMQLRGQKGTVWCFIGDAAYLCGLTKECIRYAEGHDLPIRFVVEDNNRCVRANTQEVWGNGSNNKTIYYTYNPEYPHSGSGKYVMW